MLSQPATSACAHCRGTLHLLVNGRWRRCACATTLITEQFVVASLKRGAEPLPEPYRHAPVWPLVSLAFADVSWDDFRFMARASIEPRADEGIGYAHTDDVQLKDVMFERLQGPCQSVHDFVDYDLVILDLCRHPVDISKFHRAAVGSLLSWRHDKGRPTWVYLDSLAKARLGYGDSILPLLEPVRTSVIVEGPARDVAARQDVLASRPEVAAAPVDRAWLKSFSI